MKFWCAVSIHGSQLFASMVRFCLVYQLRLDKDQTMAAKKKTSAKRSKSNNSTPRNELRQAGAADISADESYKKGQSPSASTRATSSNKRYRAAEAKFPERNRTTADYTAMMRKAGVTAAWMVPKTKPRRGTR